MGFDEIKNKYLNNEITLLVCEELLNVEISETEFQLEETIKEKLTRSLGLNRFVDTEYYLKNKKLYTDKEQKIINRDLQGSWQAKYIQKCKDFIFEIKDTNIAAAIPEWIQHLINKGYIESDGVTARQPLIKIAPAIREFTKQDITRKHLERFINSKTGKPFAKKTIDEMVNFANNC